MKTNHLFIITVLLIFFKTSQIKAQDLESIHKQKPIAITGNLGLGTSVYYSNSLNPGNSPFGYAVNGSVNVSLYGLYNIPINVFMTNLSRGASAHPIPLTNLGFQPTYKRFTFYGGWNTVNFSQFTLAGAPFVGGGVEYRGNWFRAGVVGGRFQKAYGDTVALERAIGYKRMGLGAKLGFGSEKTFIDFTFFRARDDSNSLSFRPIALESRPKDNIAGGTNWRVGFFKNRMTFEGELAVSALTRDLALKAVDLDAVVPQFSFVEKVINIRYSTSLYYAGSTGLAWQGKKGQVKLQYRRVSKDYQSLGAIYIQNNLESYTANAGWQMWKNRLRFNLTGGVQHDELPLIGSTVNIKDRLLMFATAGAYAKNLKADLPVFTYRRIGSGSLSFNPNQFYGLDISYSNFLTDQQIANQRLLDTARTAQATTTLSVVNRFTIAKPDLIHNIIGVYSYSVFDNNATQNPTIPLSIGNNTVGTVTYSAIFPKQRASANLNLNYTRSAFGSQPITYYGIMGGGSKSLLKNKMNLGGNIGYGINKTETGRSGNVNFSINAGFQPSSRQSFNASIALLRNKAAQVLAPTLGEFRGNIGYNYTF